MHFTLLHFEFSELYPIIEKALLTDSRFTLLNQCASSMAKISNTYKVNCGISETYIQFFDSMNLFQCTLNKMSKTMGLDVQKQEVDHSIITMENYKE